MKLTLTVFAAIMAVVLISYSILALKKGERKGYMLFGAFLMCGGIYMLLGLGLYVPEKVLSALYSIALGMYTWVLYFLALFTEEMCDKRMTRTRLMVLRIIVVIDSAIYITNPLNSYAVKFEKVDFHGVELLKAGFSPLYVTHGLICYIILFYILVLLVNRAVSSSLFYRKNYIVGIVGVCAIVISGGVCVRNITSGLSDIALLMNVISAVTLFHVEYRIAPRSLLIKLQDFVSDNIADGIAIYDVKGHVVGINKLALEILDEDIRKDVKKIKEFLSFPEPDQVFTQEIKGRLFSIVYRQIFDKKGRFSAEIFIFHVITAVEKRIDREQKIARIDSLTNAYNRKGFFEAANEFLYENEAEAGFALMICGIMNFKGINSSYGARVGDNVLKTIERKFHEYHHSYPMIYGRTAEGKFALLLPFDYVDEIAADMSYVQVPVDVDVNIQVDLCYGFIVLSDVSKSLDYYYERALIALNEGKRRNAAVALEYSVEMGEKILRQQELTAEMHNAIREDQFFIELQPQIDLENRKVVGAEALVRWKHPKLGRISPAEFIPLFESNGFIANLDIHVWELAAETIREFSDKGLYEGPISVNVSQVDIKAMDIVAVFERVVKEYGIDKNKLHIEITESALADRRDLLIYTMEKLREKGFVLEIDDFGSGYSSLNALMQLPFDIVKLDMDFMKSDNLSGKNGIILNSMAGMIHELGAEIIVEGVETETNVENMVRFGGDVAQGYYFSRPLPVDAFIEYVKNFR